MSKTQNSRIFRFIDKDGKTWWYPTVFDISAIEIEEMKRILGKRGLLYSGESLLKMRIRDRLFLLWPLRIDFRFPEKIAGIFYKKGRRWDDYLWSTFSLGCLHFEMFPTHNRKVWISVSWKEGRTTKQSLAE